MRFNSTNLTVGFLMISGLKPRFMLAVVPTTFPMLSSAINLIVYVSAFGTFQMALDENGGFNRTGKLGMTIGVPFMISGAL